MNRHRIVIQILLLFLFLSACHRQPGHEKRTGTDHNVIIEGVLENGEGKTISLEIMGGTEFIPLDTTLCDDRGEFQFRFNADQPSFLALRASEKGYVTLLVVPGENVKFHGNYLDARKYQVQGSPGSELINELAIEHRKVINAMAEISKKNRESVSLPDYSEIKPELDRQFDSLANSFYNYSIDFIHMHSNSLAILIALYNQYGYGLPVFSLIADMDLYHFVDSSLYSTYPENEAVKLLHAQLGSMQSSESNGTILQGPAVGEKAPDFVMRDIQGKEVALSDFRGKYVLLGFWAAWSRPSREENHYLRQAYKIFNPSGFEIVQVSVDDNRALWLDAIRADSLSWCQLGDLKRWDSKVIDLYSIEKIPSNYLISPDGTVLDKDLFGEELIRALSKRIE